MPTPHDTRTYTALASRLMCETEQEAADYWHRVARAEGFRPAGDPTVTEADEVPDGEKRLWGGAVPWLIEGPVTKPVPVPVMTPSMETVENAAQAVAKRHGQYPEWEQTPAHVRNYYMNLALDAFTAAGPRLVRDAVTYLAEHAQEYDADSDALNELAARVGDRADL